jgi:hypothetical protein
MPRTSNASLDQIIQNTIAPVVQRAAAAIAQTIAAAAEESTSRQLGPSTKRAVTRRGRGGRVRPRRRDVEMTEWTADRRARRVPTFVIEATGLDTKKKIVAKFGENATFHKDKPLPALKQPPSDRSCAPTGQTGTRQVAAKPPRVRKETAG